MQSRPPQLRDHAPLVRLLALRMLGKLSANVELDDLIQVGMIGLHDAIERWEDTGEAAFESYATTRIKGAMLDEVRRGDPLPREVRKKLRAVDSTTQLLAHKHSRWPTDGEIAGALSMPVRDYQRLVSQNAFTVPFEDEHDMPDESANPEDRLRGYRMHLALAAALEALPDKERFAMSMYYEHDMKLREIGAVLGVTESRVSQLLRDISLRLREQLREH